VADVFSPWEANPLRIEWSGDSVASLREFDTSTQRSVKRLTQASSRRLEFRPRGLL
jgi:transcription-repair coupling factor (superfamily II helicase)